MAQIHDGMTVAPSAGTTTWQVARRLRGGGLRDLTFVTNSLNVAGARRVVVVADSSKLGQVSLAGAGLGGSLLRPRPLPLAAGETA